jgi:hypothetical protein
MVKPILLTVLNVIFKVKHEQPKILLELRHNWPAGLWNAVDCILFQLSVKEWNHEQRPLRIYALETLTPNQ